MTRKRRGCVMSVLKITSNGLTNNKNKKEKQNSQVSFFKNKSKIKIFILQAKPPQIFQENEELKIEIQCLKKFFFIELNFAARNEPNE